MVVVWFIHNHEAIAFIVFHNNSRMILLQVVKGFSFFIWKLFVKWWSCFMRSLWTMHGGGGGSNDVFSVIRKAWRMAASISATMFFWGIIDGVWANLGPFSRIDRFTGKVISMLLFWLQVDFKFAIFLECRTLMFSCTDWVLLSRNCLRADKVASSVNAFNSCLVVSTLMWAWQIEILAGSVRYMFEN